MRITTAFTAAFVGILLSAGACAGPTRTGDLSTTSDATIPEEKTSSVERPTLHVDELVAIDNGRMRIRCAGSGTATVLLLAGWGGAGDNWGAIQPAISQHARVCSYARLGTGDSDAPRSTQTFATQVRDLHALLGAAGEPGPYVVVGHSFGGAQAVTFASEYADEVAGLLLVDASPTTWPATVCSVPAFGEVCAAMRDPSLDPEKLNVFAAFDQVAAITSLDDLPMTVVTAANRDAPDVTPAELARLDAVWAEGTNRWASLSSNTTIITVDDTGHHIAVDQPRSVIREVLDLLTLAAAT